MFGDLLGNMQEQQVALQEKLDKIELTAKAGDGAVEVTVTATQRVVNISIDKTKIDVEDMEQLEDFLIIALNQALYMATDAQTLETNNMVKDMLPGGLGGLGGLFGK